MNKDRIYLTRQNIGSGEFPGKMLLVRIIENNEIDVYSRAG